MSNPKWVLGGNTIVVCTLQMSQYNYYGNTVRQVHSHSCKFVAFLLIPIYLKLMLSDTGSKP